MRFIEPLTDRLGGPGGLPIDVVNAEALVIGSFAGNATLSAGLAPLRL